MRNRLVFTRAIQRHKNGVNTLNCSFDRSFFSTSHPRKATKHNSGIRNQCMATSAPLGSSPGQESVLEPIKEQFFRKSPASCSEWDAESDEDLDRC